MSVRIQLTSTYSYPLNLNPYQTAKTQSPATKLPQADNVQNPKPILIQVENPQKPKRNSVVQLAIRIIQAIGLWFVQVSSYIDRGLINIGLKQAPRNNTPKPAPRNIDLVQAPRNNTPKPAPTSIDLVHATRNLQLKDDTLTKLNTRVQSIAIDVLNHRYSAGTIEEKRAFENYIAQILEQKTPHLNIEQRQKLAEHIAQAPSVYDNGGMCLGYAWMFALYLLKHRRQNIALNELLSGFVKDPASRLIPVVCFACIVDVSNFIQVDNDQVTIMGNSILAKLNIQTKYSIERVQGAVQTLQKLAYPTIKRDVVDSFTIIEKTLKGLKANAGLEIASAANTVQTACAIGSPANQNFERIESYNKLLEKATTGSLELDDDIKLLGKHHDGSALVFFVQAYEGVGHAMTIYCSESENQFLFFDSNRGVINFASLNDLATGVKNYVQSTFRTNQAYRFEKFTL